MFFIGLSVPQGAVISSWEGKKVLLVFFVRFTTNWCMTAPRAVSLLALVIGEVEDWQAGAPKYFLARRPNCLQELQGCFSG